MRQLLILASVLIPILTYGQENGTGSLFYELTKRTLDGNATHKIKICKGVTDPTTMPAWHSAIELLRTNKHLAEVDIKSIPDQLDNPVIKTWDVNTIRQLKGARLVKKPRGSSCFLISLPVISVDRHTIVIFYQILDKKSAAGFLTIWKESGGEWIKEIDMSLWITSNDGKMHTTRT